MASREGQDLVNCCTQQCLILGFRLPRMRGSRRSSGTGVMRPGAEGSIRRARFTIGGQSVLCTDSVVKHSFSFTPSFSFFVECGYEDEVRRLSHVLKEGGSEMMPVANYGFSAPFAWVSDRFGVSWQLNCG